LRSQTNTVCPTTQPQLTSSVYRRKKRKATAADSRTTPKKALINNFKEFEIRNFSALLFAGLQFEFQISDISEVSFSRVSNLNFKPCTVCRDREKRLQTYMSSSNGHATKRKRSQINYAEPVTSEEEEEEGENVDVEGKRYEDELRFRRTKISLSLSLDLCVCVGVCVFVE
jgi:hypothetical protein